MDWWQALILGLVQGLTEFLPVSSSGHLAIGKTLLGVEVADDPVFEVVVHCATVLSTIIIFRKQIWSLLKGFFTVGTRNFFTGKWNDETDYLFKIALSMVPVFVVGMFFKDQVVDMLQSIKVVGYALLATSVLLALSDYFDQLFPAIAASRKEHRNGIGWLQAFVVGVAQAVAVIPGLSRSGTTIATGLLCGVKREQMAQFSFLMVLVPILGEMFLDIVGGDLAGSGTSLTALGCGFITAFVSGLFACKVMIALVKRARLVWFAIYCALVGAAVLIFA